MATLNNSLVVKVKMSFDLTLKDAVLLRIAGKKYFDYFKSRFKSRIEKIK